MNWKAVSAILVLALAALMILVFLQVSWPTADVDQNSINDLGERIFGNATDPAFSPVVIMLAVLLLGALLGAVFLAKEEEGER